MQKKRKKILPALLLLVHALLLFHEVTVNRVLCYKPDGSVELEMAMFDYQCPCKDSSCCDKDHHHDPVPLPQTQKTVCDLPDTCYDQPFNGSWLERNINPDTEETRFVKLSDIYIEINDYSDDTFGCFFESLPLRKFLNGIPPEYSNIALRC